MRKILFFVFLFVKVEILSSQVVFTENFEHNGSLPPDWTQEFELGNKEWYAADGGHDTNTVQFPPAAFQGDWNVLFEYISTFNRETRLLPPAINLDTVIKPQLTFFHAQEVYTWGSGSYSDELRIHYRTHEDSAWKELKHYQLPTSGWVERTFELPRTIHDPEADTTYYLSFTGWTNGGHGVCIDSVVVEETGIQPRYVSKVLVEQTDTSFIPSGSNNNPILRINLKVYGNTGDAILDSLSFIGLNDDNNDVIADGVKLFYTGEGETFSAPVQVGSPQSFITDTISFENLNFPLSTGDNFLWITYDVPLIATHGNTLDAMLPANSIIVSDTLHPVQSYSPSGKRKVYETIFFDDFETDKGWILSGEFQRDIPQGLGGTPGSPDPSYAYSGSYVLGTDLTGLNAYPGNYEPDLTERQYQAISPSIDAYYYKDVKLSFRRWLNMDLWDSAFIDVSTDNGATWEKVWESTYNFFVDNIWKYKEIDLSAYADYAPQLKIRFALGATDDDPGTNYSGWNIDDLVLTGNYLSNDIEITQVLSPELNACGMSENEPVSMWIRNNAGEPTPDSVLLGYSFDFGVTFTYDTIYNSIPVGDSILFVFSDSVDLSEPDLYNMRIQTFLPYDEIEANNIKNLTILSNPNFKLSEAPYYQDFEAGIENWTIKGKNSNWEHGIPTGTVINHAASGSKAWVTQLSGDYQNNDSSWLLSPCYNFEDVRLPIVDFNVFYHTDSAHEGTALQYSLDGGQTWDTIGKPGDELLWYTDTLISQLKINYNQGGGFTGNSEEWKRARTFLPDNIKGNNRVLFRILFASNDYNNNYEGIGIDDIHLAEAPPDVGIVAVLSPDSACVLSDQEIITLSVKNFGPDTLFAGEVIPLSVEFNDDTLFLDTLILTAPLPNNDSVAFTIRDTVDMSLAGSYKFVAATHMYWDDGFYNTNNDTLVTQVAAYGMPNYDVFPDLIGTLNPDTVILDAGPGFDSYLWQDGSATQTYDVDTAGLYHVFVTNSYSCTAADTVLILKSVSDYGIARFNIESECWLGDQVPLSLGIKNYGLDTLNINDTISIVYSLYDSVYIDSFIVDQQCLPDSVIDYTCQKLFDLSEDTMYTFSAYTIFEDDLQHNNDTLHKEINIWGYPLVDIGDTIFTLRPDTLILTVDTGYFSYIWQDGSVNDTFEVSNMLTSWYSVTVTNDHACQTTDSLLVISYDLAMVDYIHPDTTDLCGMSANQPVIAKMINNNLDTFLLGQRLILGFKLNNEPMVTDTVFLSENLYPDDTLTHHFSDSADLSLAGVYNFRFYNLVQDADASNDLFSDEVTSYGNVTVSLGGTNDSIETNVPVVIKTIPENFKTYLWHDGSNEPIYVAVPPEIVYVTVTDVNNCVASDSVIVAYPYGIADFEDDLVTIIVYPNPADDFINMEINNPLMKALTIELFSEKGILIRRFEWPKAKTMERKIPVNDLSAATYFIRIMTENRIRVIPLVIH